MENIVIFCIDNGEEIRVKKKFLKTLDNLIAMQKLNGSIKLAFGMYGGELESSYIMTRQDFDKFILSSDWIRDQLSVAVVTTDQKGRQLLIIDDLLGNPVLKGELESVRSPSKDDWTYRPDLKLYWQLKG